MKQPTFKTTPKVKPSTKGGGERLLSKTSPNQVDHDLPRLINGLVGKHTSESTNRRKVRVLKIDRGMGIQRTVLKWNPKELIVDWDGLQSNVG